MVRVAFVDTETGGFKKPVTPIEAAWIVVEGAAIAAAKKVAVGTERYRNTQPMEYGAIAVHHILPTDLAECPLWNPTIWARHIGQVDYIVGHNVDFDWEVVGSPNIKRICTLAIARYLYPDLDSHKLGAMMYFMCGLNEETSDRLQGAHSALVDIQNTYELLLKMVEDANTRPDFNIRNWGELYEVSETGRIPYRMTFGKYGPKDGNPGMRIRDLRVQNPGYVSWLKKNCGDDKYLMKALDNPR